MTPREPDRFDKQARELVAQHFGPPLSRESVPWIAAALRAAESSALERAAQAVEDTEIVRRGALTYEPWDDAQATLSNATKAIRALIPPAADPAVKRCGATNDNDRAPSVCVLPKWHPGNHYETNVASWSSEHAAETGKAQGAEARIAELEAARDAFVNRSEMYRTQLHTYVQKDLAAQALLREIEQAMKVRQHDGMLPGTIRELLAKIAARAAPPEGEGK